MIYNLSVSKKLYISLLVFLTACAIAIITCCIIFASPGSTDDSADKPLKFGNDYIHFGYGSSISIIYGDEYDLSPIIDSEAGECNISYISKDLSIIGDKSYSSP